MVANLLGSGFAAVRVRAKLRRLLSGQRFKQPKLVLSLQVAASLRQDLGARGQNC